LDKNKYIQTYCVGCGLCQSVINTNFINDARDFPCCDLDEKSDLNFYEKTCPIYYYQDDCMYDIWGKVDKAYIAYSSDETTRYKAASGGALTELCCYLLHERCVDGIIHTTFNPENPTETISCVSTTEEEVRSRCGSRYSISVPLKNILKQIESGKKYAFVGKPCDVMALRRFINNNVKYKNTFVCLLSFFCAGEPSRKAQKILLEKMGSSVEQCKELTYRGNGWPGYTTAVNRNGTVNKIEYKVAWGECLGRDLRKICHYCMDGTGDAADLVCADFWHLDENTKPDFSEHEGRNIIISRSKLGSEILNGAISEGYLLMTENFTKKIDQLYKYQPNHYKRKATMKTMLFALKLCGREVPNYNSMYLRRCGKQIRYKEKVHFFMGTIKRILQGRL
jgi:coenzyme F420 hydrogenase subunit beta